MIIGIDLGTSTSEVSYLRDGKPELIRDIVGSHRGILPSVVGLNPRGSISVGGDAIGLLSKPGMAVQEIKREMGKSTRVSLGAEQYSPQEVSSFLLRHLREEASRYLGEQITDAVITVPAYFTDAQRQATEDAGRLAGLNVRRLINEPTAAALAYGIERPGVEEKILVYDLGGGTLDVTVLELSEGYLDVFASTGNTRLGGKDFDEALMKHIALECRRATGVDLMASDRGRLRLKPEARRAKESLSSVDHVTVVFDNIGLRPDGTPIDFDLEITRDQFSQLILPLVHSTREQLDEALGAKGLQTRDIATILMIGGSTRIPAVRDFVSEYFGGRALKAEVSPDEAVSLGAAVLAGILDRQLDTSKMVITDVCPFTLGVAVRREVGDGEYRAGFFDPLIEKQSTIPRTAKKSYSTAVDWQDAVHVQVFQGEADRCEDNEPITDFHHPMEPAPAGAEVEIALSYDLNGQVVIVARDPRTGKETKVEVRVGNGRLSAEERQVSQARVDAKWNASAASQSPPREEVPPKPAPSATPSDEAWKTAPLYQHVAALMAHAARHLNGYPAPVRAKVAGLLGDMQGALARNDGKTLDRLERQLTDVLFELG